MVQAAAVIAAQFLPRASLSSTSAKLTEKASQRACRCANPPAGPDDGDGPSSCPPPRGPSSVSRGAVLAGGHGVPKQRVTVGAKVQEPSVSDAWGIYPSNRPLAPRSVGTHFASQKSAARGNGHDLAARIQPPPSFPGGHNPPVFLWLGFAKGKTGFLPRKQTTDVLPVGPKHKKAQQ